MGDQSQQNSYLNNFFSVFKHYLLVNSTEQPTYLMTRQHLGSYAAFLLAGYNTFLLRQKIIKTAIYITRSNRPHVVMAASSGVGCLYYVGLCCVWHVPSFFSELAVRVYCSAENAATTVLFQNYLRNQILSEKRIEYILKDYN